MLRMPDSFPLLTRIEVEVLFLPVTAQCNAVLPLTLSINASQKEYIEYGYISPQHPFRKLIS